MQITVKHGSTTIAQVDISHPDDWFTLDVDGEPLLGFDCFYLTGENTDPVDPGSDPKIVIGCWTEPEGEGWKRIAIKPLDRPIERATGRDSL